MDRIQLNAAIDALIESKGFLKEARDQVYAFGLSLRDSSPVSGSVQIQTPGEHVTGFTQEHGNVDIESKEDKVRKLEFAIEKERIGHYKLWREKERSGNFGIVMGHYWKLDQGTESETEEAQVWRLACNSGGPVWFGERVSSDVFNRFSLCIRRHQFLETWGDSVGKLHHSGFVVSLSL